MKTNKPNKERNQFIDGVDWMKDIITVIRLILSITKTINCWSNFKIKIILKINNEIAAKINWFVDEIQIAECFGAI